MIPPTLDRAVELLWESGHPQVGEALRDEVLALAERAERLERVLYPRVVEEAPESESARS